ncbi:hypothetical protein GGX14DRAFT_573014 [Mycena pura]|uniref:Uncharacterized protein n=1 Tax=Mycena pura TaxID=153505 RepID=A0AAD6Y3F2_9AGAR|nr:hypothetical protein GGX14DRAFT_580256 [Mycena pura]KAJ7199257.1 hypothetical protein GGX14DRAFT_573014 [Mycena pura]
MFDPVTLAADGLRPPSGVEEIAQIPASFPSLRLHPLGLYDLRRRLGLPSTFKTYLQRFLASDIAWLATGSSTDGQHRLEPDAFHSEFHSLRDALPIGDQGNAERKRLQSRMLKLLHDVATAMDRMYGSTTLLMNVSGTTVPGTPPRPEFLRASVSFPPAFTANNPDSQADIALIVQLFLERIGVPTVTAWRAKALALGWNLHTSNPRVPRPNAHSDTLVPAPEHGSASYTFFGRPAGVLNALVAAPVVVIPDDDEDDEAAQRRHRIEELEEQQQVLVAQVDSLELQVQDLKRLLLRVRQARTPATPPPSSRPEPLTPAPRGLATNRLQGPSPSRAPASRNSRLAGSDGAFSSPPPYTAPSGPLTPALRQPMPVLPRNHLEQLIATHGLAGKSSQITTVLAGFDQVHWYQELVRAGLTTLEADSFVNALVDQANGNI